MKSIIFDNGICDKFAAITFLSFTEMIKSKILDNGNISKFA